MQVINVGGQTVDTDGLSFKLDLGEAEIWEDKGVQFTCVTWQENTSKYRILFPNSLSRIELAKFLVMMESMFQDGLATDPEFREVSEGLEIVVHAD